MKLSQVSSCGLARTAKGCGFESRHPDYLFDTLLQKEVVQVATSEEVEAAITAVRNGVATRNQEELVRRAAKQAGSVGNRARDAFKGR